MPTPHLKSIKTNKLGASGLDYLLAVRRPPEDNEKECLTSNEKKEQPPAHPLTMRKLWVVLFSMARRISRNRPTPLVRLLLQCWQETGRKNEHSSQTAVCRFVSWILLLIKVWINSFSECWNLKTRDTKISFGWKGRNLQDRKLYISLRSSKSDFFLGWTELLSSVLCTFLYCVFTFLLF